MYISELVVRNFKSFGADHPPLSFNVPNGDLGSGLNIFLGENNTGKSTIFEAFDFLRNKTNKPSTSIVNRATPDAEASIELVFSGDIDSVIEEFSPDNKKAAFRERVYTVDGVEYLRFKRTSEDKNPIVIWHPERAEFSNVSGIDAPIKSMFETNFVWADTNPNDETKFGASTVTGNLLGEILNNFTNHEQYEAFIQQYDSTFNSPGSNLKQQLREIEQTTQRLFENQFGAGSIRFQFDQVSPKDFFKNVKVYVNDGTETSIEDKGSGMQRAVALAMLQVYADIVKNQPEGDILKPLFLFIDEPEICLHPKAQEKLFNALLELSKTSQIFITTHSPYFLTNRAMGNMALFICRSGDNGPEITNLSNEGLFPWSPTWGEINYLAYDMPTVDLHNELYGRLQELTEHWSIPRFDDYLLGQGIPKNKNWREERGGVPRDPYDVTLMTFIRHKIHHPENATMQAQGYSQDELRSSIEFMIDLLNEIEHGEE